MDAVAHCFLLTCALLMPSLFQRQHGRSDFYFNLVPAYLQLPGGQDALIVRSVNGTSWATGTTSTTLNPDKLTLTTFVDKDGANDMKSVSVQPIHASSVILEPTGPAEACGVQDPRISYNPADETYYMTYCTYGTVATYKNEF